jgi:hypothetical protein
MDSGPSFRVIRDAGTPPSSGGRPKRWAWIPLDDLALQDAIEVRLDDTEMQDSYASITSWVYRQSKMLGKKFSLRKTDTGYTIWRTQ